MIEFRDALTDLLEEFGTDDGGGREEDKVSGTVAHKNPSRRTLVTFVLVFFYLKCASFSNWIYLFLSP